jgi:hypothetical protein
MEDMDLDNTSFFYPEKGSKKDKRINETIFDNLYGPELDIDPLNKSEAMLRQGIPFPEGKRRIQNEIL